METLCIIPARGGSKSIPKKNIADLGGKPLIAYSIGAAKGASCVSRVIVSTDNPEIAETSRKFGAEVPFMRPAELALDTTPTIPVIEHALKWLADEEGYRPDYVLLLQPTEPFVTSKDIDALFDLVIQKNADSGITVVEVPRIFHPYHVRHETPLGFLEFDDPQLHYEHPNRQSDPKRYAFGNCYIVKSGNFLNEKKLEVGKRIGLPIDPMNGFDINTPGDLEMARLILKQKNS